MSKGCFLVSTPAFLTLGLSIFSFAGYKWQGAIQVVFYWVFYSGVCRPFLFTVVYKLVQHDFLPGCSHSSDCTDPQQGGGGKCFRNGSQDRAQLHNCTKEKGFFLFCFSFPYPPAYWKKCCWKAGWKKLQHRSSLWGHEMYWNVPPVLWLVLFLFQVWHLQEGAKRPYTANLHRGH